MEVDAMCLHLLARPTRVRGKDELHLALASRRQQI
jgi:hypothetical protein